MTEEPRIDSGVPAPNVQGPVRFKLKGAEVFALFIWLLISTIGAIFFAFVFFIFGLVFLAGNADAIFVYFLGSILTAWYITLRVIVVSRKGRSWSGLGFRQCKPIYYLIGLFALGVLVAVEAALETILGIGSADRRLNIPFEYALKGTSLLLIFARLFLMGPVLAFIEETIFRGALFGWLRQGSNITVSATGSSLFFAFIHYWILAPNGLMGLYLLLHLVTLGIVLAFLFERSRSLWPSIVAHAVNNVMLVS